MSILKGFLYLDKNFSNTAPNVAQQLVDKKPTKARNKEKRNNDITEL